MKLGNSIFPYSSNSSSGFLETTSRFLRLSGDLLLFTFFFSLITRSRSFDHWSMMRGDRYTNSCIRSKYRPMITLISNWRSNRLEDALDHAVVRLFKSQLSLKLRRYAIKRTSVFASIRSDILRSISFRISFLVSIINDVPKALSFLRYDR